MNYWKFSMKIVTIYQRPDFHTGSWRRPWETCQIDQDVLRLQPMYIAFRGRRGLPLSCWIVLPSLSGIELAPYLISIGSWETLVNYWVYRLFQEFSFFFKYRFVYLVHLSAQTLTCTRYPYKARVISTIRKLFRVVSWWESQVKT